MTEPGWYGEPGNPTLERFWDGAQWTPQTRRLTQAPEPSPAVEPKVCAVGPCTSPRLDGKLFCSRHVGGSAATPSRPKQASPVSRLVCPHCQVAGKVISKQVKQKKGVSGGKLTGAVLTGGISMLGTGLSRKETVTQMHCFNCGTTWVV